MKKILFLAMLLVVALTGCKNYDDDIDDINARLAALETWEASVNTNITALQTAITALQGKDYVTGVVALSDGSGYQITFQNSGTVTIKNGTNGKDGVTPVIGVKKDTDGYYYWTVDTGSGATWLKDANGKMIRTTGDTPKMKIGDDGYWYVAADGVNFVTTGVKAQGDAVFAENGVTVGSTSVTFTLADGTTFVVPLYQALKIAEDITDDIIEVPKDTVEYAVTLPKGLNKSDFASILAKIECNAGSSMDLQTRATATGTNWGVKMVMPTYQSDGLCNADAKVIVYRPTSPIAESVFSLLTLTISMKDGTTLVASRTLQFNRNNLIRVQVGDIVYSDGTCSPASSLATYGSGRTAIGVCFLAHGRLIDGENDAIYVTGWDESFKLGYRTFKKPSVLHGYIVALNNATTSDVSLANAKAAVSSYNTAVDISSISDGWFLPAYQLIDRWREVHGAIDSTLSVLGTSLATNISAKTWCSTNYSTAQGWTYILSFNKVNSENKTNLAAARMVAII
jgi:hypothetical protein